MGFQHKRTIYLKPYPMMVVKERETNIDADAEKYSESKLSDGSFVATRTRAILSIMEDGVIRLEVDWHVEFSAEELIEIEGEALHLIEPQVQED